MYDVKSEANEVQAQGSRAAPAPGKQTLTSAIPPAAPASSTPPPEVLARVGAVFTHTEDKSAVRRYQITATGGFLLVSSSDGKPGNKLEFRPDNLREAWATLCSYVVKNQATIPATKPAAPAPTAPAPTAPAADDLWSLVGMTRAVGNGLAGAVDAVAGATDGALGVLGGGVQAVEDAITGFFGATPAAPADDVAVTPADDLAPSPDASPEAPAAPDTGKPTSIDTMPVMSQFRWYDTSFNSLGIDDVFAAATLIADTFGLGGPVEKVTEPSAKVKKNNPNQGYWWFDAEGQPAWNGTTGTQYVTFTIRDGETSSKLNPISAYLAEPASPRPATLDLGGKPIDVPAAVRALNLRNIPGPKSCLATSVAMMAQAGVHDVGGSVAQGIVPVSGETYRAYTDEETTKYPDEADRKKHISREVTGVTTDAAAAIKAKAYIDFELDHARPVLTGITYKEANGNNDKRTDHWVVINGRTGAGYTCNDPADGSSDKQLVWAGDRLHREAPNPAHPEYLYVVSWIRPNAGSLQEWDDHWKRQAGGAEAKTPA